MAKSPKSEGRDGGRSAAAASGSTLDRDAHFATYMALYIRLDEALWQAIQFVSAVTAVSFTFVGGIVGGQAALGGLSHNQTIAIGLLPVGVLVLLGSLSLRRIREDTRRLVKLMGEMEGSGQFFSYRHGRMAGTLNASDGGPRSLRRSVLHSGWADRIRRPSATLWYSRVFAVTGAVLVLYAVVELVHS